MCSDTNCVAWELMGLSSPALSVERDAVDDGYSDDDILDVVFDISCCNVGECDDDLLDVFRDNDSNGDVDITDAGDANSCEGVDDGNDLLDASCDVVAGGVSFFDSGGVNASNDDATDCDIVVDISGCCTRFSLSRDLDRNWLFDGIRNRWSD